MAVHLIGTDHPSQRSHAKCYVQMQVKSAVDSCQFHLCLNLHNMNEGQRSYAKRTVQTQVKSLIFLSLVCCYLTLILFLVITPQFKDLVWRFDVCILLLQKGMFEEMEEQKGIHGNIWEAA